MNMHTGIVSASDRVTIVAELSANHRQSLEIAVRTIREAAACGVDAVKLQTYTPDTLTIDVRNPCFRIEEKGPWCGRYLYDLYEEAHTPWEWHRALFETARDEGLICFSTVFDFSAADFLDEFDVPAYKIASFEIRDLPLIEYVARKGKPVLISTGIANLEDIRLAVETCRSVGNHRITLMKCTSLYPAPLELSNLKTMTDMRERFGVAVGLSDHTPGSTAPVVAAALGAAVIEKHFILDRALGGPDAAFSLEPAEMKELVLQVRRAQTALGGVTYELSEAGERSRKFGRSLFIVRDVKKGEMFTSENVRSIRPGTGMHPGRIGEVLGRKAASNISRGTPLSEDVIDG